jgi:dTDP-glucose pyrophosphorylase/predicted transcriptional regulator
LLDLRTLIEVDATVMQALKRLDQTAQRILFVVDKKQLLVGSLTDGDIRRHLLRGKSLDDDIRECYNKSPKVLREKEYTVENARRIMLKNKVSVLPVLNEVGLVVDVVSWEGIVQDGGGKPLSRRKKLAVPVVIMAGGKGKRLDPFTRVLPKPLIPIGEKPVIQIIIDRFADHGIRDFYVSVNHKAGMIKAFFDSIKTNYRIEFLEEAQPRGTAGSLRLLRGKIDKTFFVSNADIIIEEDYSKILKHHQEHENDITVVVSAKNFTIPYGVCEINNGGSLGDIKEKPELGFLVSTGFYVVDPKILKIIPKEGVYHFTQLIRDLKKRGGKVGGFPISEKSWIDVGEWDSYKAAVNFLKL